MQPRATALVPLPALRHGHLGSSSSSSSGGGLLRSQCAAGMRGSTGRCGGASGYSRAATGLFSFSAAALSAFAGGVKRPGRFAQATRAPRGALQGSRAVGTQAWQSVEHVYCINLDHRVERWRFMQEQFQRLQMPVERFSAVNGKAQDIPHLAECGLIATEALPRYYLPEEQKLFGTDLTAGGIGCAMSHFLIWRDIILRCETGNGDPKAPYLVIEDDCKMCDGFSEALLMERLSHVPDDWQIVYLGGQDLLRRQHLYEVSRGVRRLYKGFRETTAYVINADGAKACLEVCVPMHWQVDTHLNDESLRHGLKHMVKSDDDVTMHPRGYCLWPPIVAQDRDGFPTDVQKCEHD
eukprot:TRINITY_DN77685_c0_g1_i1.p1 TRINITY_DN77685_c0_g1~~TRINITY_DN77685_c0_g1_i1.p1  ORF type:complete len:369 (+),score=58.86 TRINITY_DN77685_c0_g1_i1:53-1108(+)